MPLFLSTEDFKSHAPEIHKNYNWSTLSKKVDQISALRIIPFISGTEYNDLETKYLAHSTSPEQKTLLTFLQPAIAYFTYVHHPELGVKSGEWIIGNSRASA